MFPKYIEYGLHDTSVNDVIVEDFGFSLLFHDGVYQLDDTGKETHLSKPCKMNIFIDRFDKNRLFEHCTFYKCYKKHFSEVDFSEIKRLLLKEKLEICFDFYSPFTSAISIRGGIGKYAIEIIITEIQSIKFETL